MASSTGVSPSWCSTAVVAASLAGDAVELLERADAGARIALRPPLALWPALALWPGRSRRTEDTSGDFRHGGWLVPFFDEALRAYMVGIFDEVDAFVLGRKTYEVFAASWPKATDPDDPIASRLNTLPKYVASRSLMSADWHNSTVLGADVVAEVTRMKEQPGRELQIHGSGALAQTLFDAGLIDTIPLIGLPGGARLRQAAVPRSADAVELPAGRRHVDPERGDDADARADRHARVR
jgi:dihydrofolate reductase